MTNEQKYEIEIPGLPEGWKPVAYRVPITDADFVLYHGSVVLCEFRAITEYLILERIKRREITLVETGEWNITNSDGSYRAQFFNGEFILANQKKIWKIKE